MTIFLIRMYSEPLYEEIFWGYLDEQSKHMHYTNSEIYSFFANTRQLKTNTENREPTSQIEFSIFKITEREYLMLDRIKENFFKYDKLLKVNVNISPLIRK